MCTSNCIKNSNNNMMACFQLTEPLLLQIGPQGRIRGLRESSDLPSNKVLMRGSSGEVRPEFWIRLCGISGQFCLGLGQGRMRLGSGCGEFANHF